AAVRRAGPAGGPRPGPAAARRCRGEARRRAWQGRAPAARRRGTPALPASPGRPPRPRATPAGRAFPPARPRPPSARRPRPARRPPRRRAARPAPPAPPARRGRPRPPIPPRPRRRGTRDRRARSSWRQVDVAFEGRARRHFDLLLALAQPLVPEPELVLSSGHAGDAEAALLVGDG